MIDNYNKAPEFTKKQKLLIIPLAFYVIGMIIYLCYAAEHTADLSVRRIHALLVAAPFIIYTVITFILEFAIPDRQLIITKFQEKYWFLTNYDYKPGKVIHRKEANLFEIYFDNEELLPFCLLYYYKPNIKSTFFGTEPSENGICKWENVFWLELELTGNFNDNYKSNKIVTDEDEKECICTVIEKIKENKERVSQVIDWLYNPDSGNSDEVYSLISEKSLPSASLSEIMEDDLYKSIVSKSQQNSNNLDEQKQFLLRFLQLLPAEKIISFLLKVDSLIKSSDSEDEKAELENFLYPANAAFTLSTGKKMEDYINI